MIEARVGKALAADARYAWVTMVGAGGIAIIDTATYQWVSAKVSETNPYGIAATPDGSKIYVSESGTNLVSSFDVAALRSATAKVAGTAIVVGIYPHGVVVSPDGARAYVANTGPDNGGAAASDTVSVIQVATDAVVGAISVGSAPQVVAVSPDSKQLFVTCAEGLYQADTASQRGRLVTGQCAQAHGVAVSPDGASVYVADSTNNRVLVVDGSGRSVIGRIPVGACPWNIAFTADGSAAYVTNSNDDTVSVIDTRSRRVIKTIPVARIPTGIGCYGGEMWVTGNVSSTVSVIDTRQHRVTQTIPLGISTEPITVAFA